MSSLANETTIKKVAVVTTIYNSASTLVATLNSLKNQTDTAWVSVCVLNKCTDNSESVLRSFIETNGLQDKVHVVYENDQQGHVPASNAGVYYSVSLPDVTHIARLDSDDVWHPAKLEFQRRFLEENPDVSVVGSNMRLIERDTGRHIGNTNYPLSDDDMKMAMANSVNPIGNSSSLFDKKVVYRCGAYDDLFGYGYCEDFWLWLKASRWFKFANLPATLVDYTSWHNPKYDANIPRLAAFSMSQIQQHSPLQYPKNLQEK